MWAPRARDLAAGLDLTDKDALVDHLSGSSTAEPMSAGRLSVTGDPGVAASFAA